MNVFLECPTCIKPLEVDTAWAGQPVDCPLCGNPFIVPDCTPTPVARAVGPPPLPTVPAVALWNPSAAANWSLLFSPIFGSLLHYLNWRTLGDQKKASKAMGWVVFSVIVSLGMIVVSGSSSAEEFRYPIALVLLLGWYFAAGKEQIGYVKTQYGTEYRRRSWAGPITLAVTLSIVLLLAVGALTVWRDVSELSGEETASNSRRQALVVPAPAMPAPVAPTSVGPVSPLASASQLLSAKAIYEVTGEDALQAARKFLIGTWIYTGQQWKVAGQTFWVKWVIREDGTVDVYRAAATADNWGSPKPSKWEIETGKYANTGQRYYAIYVKDTGDAVILSDGTLALTISVWSSTSTKLAGETIDVTMERGDKFPFSR